MCQRIWNIDGVPRRVEITERGALGTVAHCSCRGCELWIPLLGHGVSRVTTPSCPNCEPVILSLRDPFHGRFLWKEMISVKFKAFSRLRIFLMENKLLLTN